MTTEWHESFLRTIGRWGLGLAAILGLILLSAIPLRIVHLGEVRPVFMLMAVYYWTILRPAPPLGVFALGLVLDLLSGYPLGMNALVLVLAQSLTAHNRKFLLGQSFLVIWAGFALVALGAGVLQWILFSLLSLTLVAAKPVLISTVLSAVLFPVAVLPLAAVHKALSDQSSVTP
jgi:rod shape-determining protein MreD